jgi:hypothetical protein
LHSIAFHCIPSTLVSVNLLYSTWQYSTQYIHTSTHPHIRNTCIPCHSIAFHSALILSVADVQRTLDQTRHHTTHHIRTHTHILLQYIEHNTIQQSAKKQPTQNTRTILLIIRLYKYVHYYILYIKIIYCIYCACICTHWSVHKYCLKHLVSVRFGRWIDLWQNRWGDGCPIKTSPNC